MICFRKIICFYGKMHQKGWLLIAKLKEIYKDHLDLEIWSGATNPLLTHRLTTLKEGVLLRT